MSGPRWMDPGSACRTYRACPSCSATRRYSWWIAKPRWTPTCPDGRCDSRSTPSTGTRGVTIREAMGATNDCSTARTGPSRRISPSTPRTKPRRTSPTTGSTSTGTSNAGKASATASDRTGSSTWESRARTRRCTRTSSGRSRGPSTSPATNVGAWSRPIAAATCWTSRASGVYPIWSVGNEVTLIFQPWTERSRSSSTNPRTARCSSRLCGTTRYETSRTVSALTTTGSTRRTRGCRGRCFEMNWTPCEPVYPTQTIEATACCASRWWSGRPARTSRRSLGSWRPLYGCTCGVLWVNGRARVGRDRGRGGGWTAETNWTMKTNAL